SLARARARLGAGPLHMLFDQVAGPVGAQQEAGVFCCELRVISMDGSTIDVPDTPANAAHFGCPLNATREGSFPQVRWLAAVESGTGALIGATFAPYTTGEQTLALDLLAVFGPRMLVLADCNFLSHTLSRDVLGTGAHIGWRASASVALRPIRVLADGTYLAKLNPACTADGPPITVRVIEYTTHTTPHGGAQQSSELFCLVTDLLDIEAYPALDLACAYPMRWEAETVSGYYKTDMGSGVAVLRSKNPKGVTQEMWALFAVYQAIHTLIGAGGIPPTASVSLTAPTEHRHGGFRPFTTLT
ncbi:MAG: transposase, partial [Pseudonocardiaceae bacterium]